MKKISLNSKSVIGGLMEYLDEKGKQSLLPELTQVLEEKIAKEKQTDEIIVTSVVRLTSLQLNALKSILHKSLRVKFPIMNKIEEHLLGGFTVKVNDMFIDLSLRNEMDTLKRSLLI